MENIRDLLVTLKRPGTRIRVTQIEVGEGEGRHFLQPTAEQGASRGVVDVNERAIWLDSGKMLPIGCQGRYEFDGSPDRFFVDIGGHQRIVYEIAQGHA